MRDELTDIDELRRTTDALRRSEAQLARAQRLSSTGSFSYTPADDAVVISDEMYRICGFDPSQPVLPRAMCECVHPDDAPLFRLMRGARFCFTLPAAVQRATPEAT